MILDFFEWYNNWNMVKEFVELDLSADSSFARGIYGVSKGHVNIDGKNYFIKTPHSRSFKFGYISLKEQEIDNKLATMSELIAEKRYKKFKFLYATHRPIYKTVTKVLGENNDLVWENRHIFNTEEIYKHGIYQLVSPALTNEYFDTISLNYMYTIRRQIAQTEEEVHMFDNFGNILESREHFLKFMTEDCYDKFVEFLIASILEFSDDDHFDNITLVKNKSSNKYEDIFVYDKESNVFNPFITKDLSLNAIKFKTRTASNYNGVPVKSMGENTIFRIFEFFGLIRQGKLKERYLKFIEELASVDYGQIAREIRAETGIWANPKQLDMYKYGADFAGIIAGLEK